MQSGDDTSLADVWEEVVVQVQGQESLIWEDGYLETIRGIILGLLDNVDDLTKQAIWLQTQNGDEWDNKCDDDISGSGPIPWTEEDMVEHILGYVLSAAEDFTNTRTEQYLELGHELD